MVNKNNNDVIFHNQNRWFGIVCLIATSCLFVFLISNFIKDHTNQKDIFSGWIAFFLGLMITASFILLTPGKIVLRKSYIELYPTLLEGILKSSRVEIIKIKDIEQVKTDVNNLIIKVQNENQDSYIHSTSSSTKARKIRRMISNQISLIKKL